MKLKRLGIVVYDGPSLLDGERIIAVASNVFGNVTDNTKIGNMVPIWIMRKDISPTLAPYLDLDKSVCGDCKHRDFGSCYVNLGHGPYNAHKAFHRNRYETLNADNVKAFDGKMIRIGAYGDPAAVPIEVWDTICGSASGWTGYTHQWKKDKTGLDYYCMASADNEKEYHKAQSMGWRIFRTRLDDEPVLDGEVVCPASHEGGQKTTCGACGLCSGLSRGKQLKSAAIIVHGSTGRPQRFKDGIKKIKHKKAWRKTKEDKLQRLANIIN